MRDNSPQLLRRLAAMIYDTLLVLPLIMLVVFLAFGLRSLVSPSEAPLNAQLVQLLALLTVLTFFSAFWLKSGQTLGMQAWRIQLVCMEGGELTLRQSVIRCLGALLSAIPLGLGYLWCLVDRNGRYWHDYLSGTELVLLAKKEKGK